MDYLLRMNSFIWFILLWFHLLLMLIIVIILFWIWNSGAGRVAGIGLRPGRKLFELPGLRRVRIGRRLRSDAHLFRLHLRLLQTIGQVPYKFKRSINLMDSFINEWINNIQQAEAEQVHGAGSCALHRSIHQESHHRAAILRQRNSRSSGKLLISKLPIRNQLKMMKTFG